MKNSKGGPRTEVGKRASSRNAIKSGLYTMQLMPGEDASEHQKMIALLRDDWDINGAQSEMLANDYMQSYLISARLRRAQSHLIESRMYSGDCKRKFLLESNLPLNKVIPDWYVAGDAERWHLAQRRAKACDEVAKLKVQHAQVANHTIKDRFPNLWTLIMEGAGASQFATLEDRLESLFRKGEPIQNLDALVSHYKTKYADDLLWAEHAQRFEVIACGLRAEVELDVLTRCHWTKLDSSLHRRRMEILQAVHGIKRVEHMTSLENALEVDANLVQTQPETTSKLKATN